MSRILIVEDEKDIANAFEKQLTMIGGFEVEIAEGGDVALEKMKETQFDLVLLDLSMRHVDGITVLQRLHEDKGKKESEYKHAPVAVLTNVTSEETKAEVEQYGVADFIVKSDIRSDGLIEKVKKLIK